MKNMSRTELDTNSSLLRLFKGYLYNKEDNVVSKEEALKYGIYLDEDVDKKLFDDIVDQYGIDGYLLNQTFHKTLKKVAESDMEKLVLDQLIHYLSTYGLEDLFGEDFDTSEYVYIPNEKLDVPELLDGVKLIHIRKLNEDEIKEKINNLITSGVALSKTTIKDIIVLSDYITIEDIEKV